MRTYPRVRKADTKQRLDQNTWAGTSFVVLSYDTIGSGELLTELIPFGAVFEDAPFFAYGVELQPGETLVSGDYPFVMCGVSEWDTTEDTGDSQKNLFYRGAYIWINVVSTKQYRLRFRLSFEGIALRNVEYLQAR